MSSKSMKFLAMLMLLPFALNALPAFPGAVGWGGDATGGRGGTVVHVTNLNAYGTGSFAGAMSGSSAKFVVFDVGGVIDLQNQVVTIPSNVTIAGQTAPGGITFKNGGLYTLYHGTTSNIILRCIRIRRSQDAPDGDCVRFTGASNFIVDHCSFMWNSDETIDLSYSTHTGTIQHCVIAEPAFCSNYYCADVGCGNGCTLLLGVGVDGRISMVRNLMAHSAKRTPFLTNDGATAWQNKTWEIINNVFYDDFQGSYESFDQGNTVPLNLIGNYYKGGLSASYPTTTLYAHSGTQAPKSMIVYAAGNRHHQFPTITIRNAFFNNLTVLGWIDTMIPPIKTPTWVPATQAYTEVLASAGPWPRDSADKRIVRETQAGTGGWMDSCKARPDILMGQIGTRPADTDNDGIPNAWETAHGLNPNLATDYLTSMNGGYNAIEVYLNELADSLISTAVETPDQFASKTGAIKVTAQPNPFNQGVRFILQNIGIRSGAVKVFDVSGKLVFSARSGAGAHTFTWNGRGMNNQTLSAGVYVARFAIGDQIVEKRVSLIR